MWDLLGRLKGAELNGSASRSVLDMTKSSRLFTFDIPEMKSFENNPMYL